MKQKLILLTVLLSALSAFSAEYFVDASRPDDSGAATNWATAKQTIQAAVDLAEDEDTVLVTNGVYGILPRTEYFDARVCVTNAIVIRSVNGPSVTVIDGGHARRGVFMTNGCALVGFTITNGRANQSGSPEVNYCGGGVWLTANCVVSDCIINGNFAQYGGGGAYLSQGGTLNNCVLTGNSAGSGGGVDAVAGVLNSCTLSQNSADIGGGGTIFEASLNNCIIWGNSSNNGGDIWQWETSSVRHTCSSLLPSGDGNICADPMFVDSVNSNFHLQAVSPCINAGQNSYVAATNDLDVNSRIVGGVVDMGAYENQTAGPDADNDGMDDLWELNRFGGRHFADPDSVCSNGMNTLRQAYIAGLDPNDPQSEFRTIMQHGNALQWPCVSGRVYSVWFSTNLLNGFQALKTNIPWTAGSFTDTVHNADGQRFYKIGVELKP